MSFVEVFPVEPVIADHARPARLQLRAPGAAPAPASPPAARDARAPRRPPACAAAAPRVRRGDEHAPGAGRERGLRVRAAVLARAGEADEQLVRRHAARVDRGSLRSAGAPPSRGAASSFAPAASATRAASQLLIADALPAGASRSSARSASRATVTSSKGSLRPSANSCPCSWPLPAMISTSPARAPASAWRSPRGDRARATLPPPPPPLSTPAMISAMIASGSSERGLSEVTITSSASREAISPISGRLPRSRSPPAPNTHSTRPPAPPGEPTISRAARSTFCERVRRVRVVDQHREVLALVDRLQAPRDANLLLERREQPLQRGSERPRARQRGERVGDVEAPRERERELALAAPRPRA